METTEQLEVIEAQAVDTARVFSSVSRRELAAVQTYGAPTDEAEAQEYARQLLEVKRRIEERDSALHFLIDPIVEHVERIRAQFRPTLDDYKQIERILKGHIGEYSVRAKAEADARQREADAVAQAERARLRAEAQAGEEKARALLAAGNAEQALEAHAQAAEVREAALMVPTLLEPAPAKLAGVSVRARWVSELVSFDAVFEYCYTHKDFRRLFKFDQSAADSHARALKTHFVIPGLEVRQVPVTAARTK